MKFFADENVARTIVKWLRERQNDVVYAAEEHPGTPDADWLRLAESEARLILTSDKDFGDLVFRDKLTSHGVVLMRMDELTVSQRISRLIAVWSVVEANPSGNFIVITSRKVRVRTMSTE